MIDLCFDQHELLSEEMLSVINYIVRYVTVNGTGEVFPIDFPSFTEHYDKLCYVDDESATGVYVVDHLGKEFMLRDVFSIDFGFIILTMLSNEKNYHIMINSNFFDLEQTEKAYLLGGKKIHWTDYTIIDDEWDEDLYYADFDSWWNGLPFSEQSRIFKAITEQS